MIIAHPAIVGRRQAMQQIQEQTGMVFRRRAGKWYLCSK